ASIFEAFVIFGIALLLIAFETLVKPYVSIAALLGIMAMGIQLQSLRRPEALEGLQSKFSDFWGAAETLLFALVAAGVDINYMFHAGLRALLLIFLCLLVRSIGVFVSLLKTGLKLREKIFVAIAYTPKATVQAAIGGLPLAYGFACGDLILSLAVLSIFVTASLGAFFTDLFAHPCLHETSQEK
ncbi:MAG: cation:proton antiporter, partial [Eubacteriales bacterium]|nr:cation:proton antiporter [Eubacteriales bacterium]